MTAQIHITNIGKALANLEFAIEETEQAHVEMGKAHVDLGKALTALKKHRDVLHGRLGQAQTAYTTANPSAKIVAFSGGTNKPSNDDPDRPVRPIR